MENFIAYNPVKLRFGKDVINDLGKSVQKIGKKVLLIYGGGSVKKNGSYKDVMDQLKSIGAKVYEYSGVQSNPLITDVDKAAQVGRGKNVDLILALGGGSVLDTAKVTAMTIPVQHSGWKFLCGEAIPQKAIPIISILTLAATGSEMNMFAVVQNEAIKEKRSVWSPLSFPVESFLDPKYTLRVPKNYTGYGITDLVAHSLEAYFGKGNSSLADRFIFSLISEAHLYGPQLMNDLDNYELRAKIMLAATYALNGTTVIGKAVGDWGVHAIGHVLSVLYDVPHGASLSIVYPAWMKFYYSKLEDRISELGQNIFDEPSAKESIAMLESFFESVNSPVRLQDYQIGLEKRQEIIEHLIKNKATGNVHKLSEEDYPGIVDLMFSAK